MRGRGWRGYMGGVRRWGWRRDGEGVLVLVVVTEEEDL